MRQMGGSAGLTKTVLRNLVWVAVSGVLSIGTVGAQEQPARWSSANADAYLLYGTNLWSVAEGRIVERRFVPRAPMDVRPVAGAPSLVFGSWPKLKDATRGGIVAGRLQLSEIGGRTPPVIFPDSLGTSGVQYSLNDDLQRLLILRDGRLYQGSLDWRAGRIANERPIDGLASDVGLLQAQPAVWHDDIVLIHGGNDPLKPVLRLDLASSQCALLPSFGVFPERMEGWRSLNVSPDGAYVVVPDTMGLRVYDVARSQVKTIGTNIGGNSPMPVTEPIWLDGSRLLFNAERFGAIGLMDLANGTARPLTGAGENLSFVQVLPGGQWIEALSRPQQSAGGGTRATERVLVEIATGAVQGTSLPVDVDTQWLDTRYAVYVVHEGEVKEIGTWLYDHQTRSVRRLTHQTSQMRDVIYKPAWNMIYLDTQQRGDIGISLVQPETQELGMALPLRAFGEPVDLGFGQ